MAKSKKTKLTDLQMRFCHEYLKDFNGTEAYLRAGYKCNRTAARTSAHHLLTNPYIQAYLESTRSNASDRAEISMERVMAEYAKIAFSDITNVLSFSDSGVYVNNSEDLPEKVTGAIESVTSTTIVSGSGRNQTETTKTGVKLHNKVAALNVLADYFGIREDFNKARAALRKYGLALVPDQDADLKWRLERYDPIGSASSDQAESAASEFIEEINE